MAKGGFIEEYDLDAPDLPKEERSNFRYQTRSLTSLYERCFSEKARMGGAWKVLVEILPSPVFSTHRNLLGVLAIQVKGDPAGYLALQDDSDKGRMALEWLQQGLMKLASEVEIDFAQFEIAAEKVRAADFVNIQRWLSPKKNPTGKLSADIVVNHAVHEAVVMGRIFDQQGEVVSQTVLTSSKPDEFIFSPLIGSLRWIDEEVAELRSKDRLLAWRFSQLE